MIENSVNLILEKAIQGSSMRHSAILNNIANVNTPQYKRTDVDFKTTLSNAVKTIGKAKANTALNTIQSVRPQTLKDNSTTLRIDGNNVDVDKEMAALSENTLEHNTYVTLLSQRFRILKTVISEGRR
jgi:flagellar basal-body rod protein FlgB